MITAAVLQEPQQMKVPQLRNLYRKVGFARTPGPKKSGFGFTHDGAVDTLASFFALPVFNPWPAATKDDLVTLLGSFDTGTAPAVGYQLRVDQGSAGSTQLANDLALLTARAAAGDLDLTAHGRVDGALLGLLWQPASASWLTDRAGVGPFPAAQLLAKAQSGAVALAVTAVPPGSGVRIARDRDLDGVWNGDEAAQAYGVATAGCAGASTIAANSEPEVGNLQFGFVLGNAQPNTFGLVVLALGPSSLPVFGVQLLVDPASTVPIGIVADGFGTATHAFPIAADPAFAGLAIHAQALWLDSCGSEWWASSAGLTTTVRP